MDQGLNFYTEYNENNKLVKEKYEKSIFKKESINDIPIAKEPKMDSVNTYIEIPNRLFLISKRGYGGWNKGLDEEEQVELIRILKDKDITCQTEGIESMFKDEERKENERSNSRVMLKIGDSDYTIQNYNVRCLSHDTAVKIASFLIKKGFSADIEILQGFSGTKVIKSRSNNKPMKKKKKDPVEQVNMFAM